MTLSETKLCFRTFFTHGNNQYFVSLHAWLFLRLFVCLVVYLRRLVVVVFFYVLCLLHGLFCLFIYSFFCFCLSIFVCLFVSFLACFRILVCFPTFFCFYVWLSSHWLIGESIDCFSWVIWGE